MSQQVLPAELVRRVRQVSWKVCRGRADYEDTVQDMLTHILERRRNKPGFADATLAYQIKSAIWAVRSQRRHQALVNRFLEMDDDGDDVNWHEVIEDDGQSLDDIVITGESITRVRQALRALASSGPRGQAKVELLIRRFYEGQFVADAAKEMGLARGTACMYCAEAFRELRFALQGAA
jgi:DNA-directed RNA polymerase specialized sigma24 family protein